MNTEDFIRRSVPRPLTVSHLASVLGMTPPLCLERVLTVRAEAEAPVDDSARHRIAALTRIPRMLENQVPEDVARSVAQSAGIQLQFDSSEASG